MKAGLFFCAKQDADAHNCLHVQRIFRAGRELAHQHRQSAVADECDEFRCGADDRDGQLTLVRCTADRRDRQSWANLDATEAGKPGW